MLASPVMSDKGILHRLKSVELDYTGEFAVKDAEQKQAVLLGMLGGGFEKEDPRGTYHNTLSYNGSELPVRMSAVNTPKGFKVRIHVTADNADQAPAVDKHFRDKIAAAGGTYRNRTFSASIL